MLIFLKYSKQNQTYDMVNFHLLHLITLTPKGALAE